LRQPNGVRRPDPRPRPHAVGQSRAARLNGAPAAATTAHRAASRVIDVLELLATRGEALGLKELSAATATPKSSLLPLLRTLSARGYLAQGRQGDYQLGPKALELGASAPSHHELCDIARPTLVELMRRTDETVFLATLASDGAASVYVDKVESSQMIRYSAGVGDRRPVHATSTGKTLLAFQPAERREEILGSIHLERHTDRTIINVPALRAALEEIRRRGVGVSMDELVPGAAGVAAPIFDRYGEVSGACTIAAPTDRVRGRVHELTAEVKAAARTISGRLGYVRRKEGTS